MKVTYFALNSNYHVTSHADYALHWQKAGDEKVTSVPALKPYYISNAARDRLISFPISWSRTLLISGGGTYRSITSCPNNGWAVPLLKWRRTTSMQRTWAYSGKPTGTASIRFRTADSYGTFYLILKGISREQPFAAKAEIRVQDQP